MSIVRYGDGTGNSGHYLIDRNGTIYRDVPYNRTAYHVIGYNTRAIGIETVNIGRYPDWFDSRSQIPLEPYSNGLILNLAGLINQLKSNNGFIIEQRAVVFPVLTGLFSSPLPLTSPRPIHSVILLVLSVAVLGFHF
jgi:N-acetyl-anhydromuramyl-L-alanine amidase AmpD